MDQPARFVLKSAGAGALIIVCAGPVFGFVFYVFQGVVTGDTAHFARAFALLVLPAVMGAAGGAAFGLVYQPARRTRGWLLIALLAAMETYLLTCSYLVVAGNFYVPALLKVDDELLDLRFHLVLHAYGLSLVTVAWGVTTLWDKFARRRDATSAGSPAARPATEQANR